MNNICNIFDINFTDFSSHRNFFFYVKKNSPTSLIGRRICSFSSDKIIYLSFGYKFRYFCFAIPQAFKFKGLSKGIRMNFHRNKKKTTTRRYFNASNTADMYRDCGSSEFCHNNFLCSLSTSFFHDGSFTFS